MNIIKYVNNLKRFERKKYVSLFIVERPREPTKEEGVHGYAGTACTRLLQREQRLEAKAEAAGAEQPRAGRPAQEAPRLQRPQRSQRQYSFVRSPNSKRRRPKCKFIFWAKVEAD